MGFLSGLGDALSGVGNFIAPGLGSIVGGAMSMIGQGKTNKANADLVRLQNEMTARNVDETNRWNYDIAARANDAARDNAREAMNFSRESADQAMAFSERMSSSAYQRVVDDMRKAGINPMLAIDQGGSSSPGGQSAAGVAAPVTTARMEAPGVTRAQYEDPLVGMGQQLGSGMSSALEWHRRGKDMFHADLGLKQAGALATLAETNNRNADTANKTLQNERENMTLRADVDQKTYQNYKTQAETALTHQETINKAIDQVVKQLGVTSAKAEEARSKTDLRFYEDEVGKALRAMELAGKSGESVKKLLPRWMQ